MCTLTPESQNLTVKVLGLSIVEIDLEDGRGTLSTTGVSLSRMDGYERGYM